MSTSKKKRYKKRKPQQVKKTAIAPVQESFRPQQWIPPFPVRGQRLQIHPIDDTNIIPETPGFVEMETTYKLPLPPEIEEPVQMSTPERKVIRQQEQEARREFLKTFRSLTGRWRSWDIWTDFVTLTACTISNVADKAHYEEREATYIRTIKKYNKVEQKAFMELFYQLVMALDANPEQDFLGSIYNELGLNSKEHRQIFTPYHLAHMMAELTLGDLEKTIKERGFVTIHDSCCGGGVTLIAAANVAKEKLSNTDFNYQNHILVTGQDIDYVVTMMCYIQLSLLGIAGYFKVGDAIAEPMSRDDNIDNYWFTLMYFFPAWHYRRIWHSLDELFRAEPKAIDAEKDDKNDIKK